MDVAAKRKIIIHGVTKEGSRFRPSDWAERLGGQLCSVVNRRLKYSPLLRPGVVDGNKCVLVCPSLKRSNRIMFHTVIKFARQNHLKVTTISGIESTLPSQTSARSSHISSN